MKEIEMGHYTQSDQGSQLAITAVLRKWDISVKSLESKFTVTVVLRVLGVANQQATHRIC